MVGGDDPILDGLRADDALDAAGRAQEMRRHGLGGADGHRAAWSPKMRLMASVSNLSL